MLKNKLKILLVIMISIIVVSGISICATYNYFAKDIIYSKPNGTKVSVEYALNELYNNANLHIETGEMTRTLGYNSWQYENITFEKEYSEIPEIYYESKAGSTAAMVYVREVSTTSFTIGYNSVQRGRTDTIKWIAIGN